MESKLSIIVVSLVILLALTRAVNSSSSSPYATHYHMPIGDEEMMMESETSRRLLAQGQNYISYDALKRNNVPCDKRGNSYYNCQAQAQSNPYKRGCSAITKCARNSA
ncbi:hypothetical protein Leryth_012719 [Lithospermum erythrorhizon]|uniref:Rapid ALkalinization Factor n=1 Tax=Lithospermum erythrorhizon TaxID=34254 RepID=A0AAV3RIA5_LITER|nr:hypothetical protein Leryth_012719 [Lithospermum erythrorhizon]